MVIRQWISLPSSLQAPLGRRSWELVGFSGGPLYEPLGLGYLSGHCACRCTKHTHLCRWCVPRNVKGRGIEAIRYTRGLPFDER